MSGVFKSVIKSKIDFCRSRNRGSLISSTAAKPRSRYSEPPSRSRIEYKRVAICIKLFRQNVDEDKQRFDKSIKISMTILQMPSCTTYERNAGVDTVVDCVDQSESSKSVSAYLAASASAYCTNNNKSMQSFRFTARAHTYIIAFVSCSIAVISFRCVAIALSIKIIGHCGTICVGAVGAGTICNLTGQQ